MKKINKAVTTYELAVMVMEGFEKVDNRLKEQDKKIERVSIEMKRGFEAQDIKTAVLTKKMEDGFREQASKTDQKITTVTKTVQHGFKEQDRKIDEKIEWLAGMVATGFEGQERRLRKEFREAAA